MLLLLLLSLVLLLPLLLLLLLLRGAGRADYFLFPHSGTEHKNVLGLTPLGLYFYTRRSYKRLYKVTLLTSVKSVSGTTGKVLGLGSRLH